MQHLWMLADAADREGQMDFFPACLEIQHHCIHVGKRWSGAFGLASRSCSSPQSSLEVQPAQAHVAHVHVATLFTNTLLGVPAPAPLSTTAACESSCVSPTVLAACSSRG